MTVDALIARAHAEAQAEERVVVTSQLLEIVEEMDRDGRPCPHLDAMKDLLSLALAMAGSTDPVGQGLTNRKSEV